MQQNKSFVVYLQGQGQGHGRTAKGSIKQGQRDDRIRETGQGSRIGVTVTGIGMDIKGQERTRTGKEQNKD